MYCITLPQGERRHWRLLKSRSRQPAGSERERQGNGVLTAPLLRQAPVPGRGDHPPHEGGARRDQLRAELLASGEQSRPPFCQKAPIFHHILHHNSQVV